MVLRVQTGSGVLEAATGERRVRVAPARMHAPLLTSWVGQDVLQVENDDGSGPVELIGSHGVAYHAAKKAYAGWDASRSVVIERSRARQAGASRKTEAIADDGVSRGIVERELRHFDRPDESGKQHLAVVNFTVLREWNVQPDDTEGAEERCEALDALHERSKRLLLSSIRGDAPNTSPLFDGDERSRFSAAESSDLDGVLQYAAPDQIGLGRIPRPPRSRSPAWPAPARAAAVSIIATRRITRPTRGVAAPGRR